nr:zinc finger, CCHC-type [Tanacetum cinerariifolium]
MSTPTDPITVPVSMPTGNALPPFLVKTYDMVDDPSSDNAVSWSSTNNSFIIHDPLEFDKLLPKGSRKAKKRQKLLMKELVRLRKQQQTTDNQMQSMVERLQGMEQRQQQMMSFFAKGVNSPGFLSHFVQHQNESTKLITKGSKKHRLKQDGVVSTGHNKLPDSQSVKYQPIITLGNSSPPSETFSQGSGSGVTVPGLFSLEVTRDQSVPLEANSNKTEGEGDCRIQGPKIHSKIEQIEKNDKGIKRNYGSRARAYRHWDAITEDEVDEKKNYTTKGIIFQTLPENVLLQVSKHKNAKYVWESIKVRYIGAERVQKARLQILRNELEMLKMNDNESINDFMGKISGIVAKFKSLASTLEEEVIVRKFLNSVPKKYLPIVAPIEQYSDLETMPFEEAVGRVKAYEERLQSLEVNDGEHGQLMLASDQNYYESSGHERGRERNFERCGRGRGRGRGDKSGIRCYDCGDFGHFSYECMKWNDKDKEANLIQDEEPTLL